VKSRPKKVRVGVIVGASFVLFFTVLPQVASALGLHALSDRLASTVTCSGSGGGTVGSSSSICGPGTVTGTVKVTKAPTGFQPAYMGAGACPDTGPAGQMCANPQYALSGSGGTYTLTLSAGTYRVSGFYENNAYGGAFLGATNVVTVTTGGTVTLNLVVPYQAPAAITGTVTVTGMPKADPIYQFNVLLCPSFAPYTGGTIPLACVNTYAQPATTGANTGTYSMSGLPPGIWTAYLAFCTQSSCGTPNPKDGTALTLVGGQTTTSNLTAKFLQPGQAFLSGTVTVTGAPTGFSDQIGVSACPQSGSAPCQVNYYLTSGKYGLILSAGTWIVKGLYLAAPYDNAVDGPAATVTLTSFHYGTQALTVPYQVLGTATGTITISGLPAGVSITRYTVLACPKSEPWTGGIPAPECVSEYSGPGGYGYGPADRNQVKTMAPAAKPPAGYAGPAQAATTFNLYSLPTLTPGSWLLYPGYQDAFGSVTSSTPTPVFIAAATTRTKNLTVAYVAPTQGAVVGTIDVIGAPNSLTNAGAQACTALPSGTTCQGEVDAYAQSGGGYTLLLAPGTWWVRGFVDVYSSSGATQSTSSPVEIHLLAGHEVKENFAVTY
jgi:hypothetical protein